MVEAIMHRHCTARRSVTTCAIVRHSMLYKNIMTQMPVPLATIDLLPLFKYGADL
jgi:hypothetical protein